MIRATIVASRRHTMPAEDMQRTKNHRFGATYRVSTIPIYGNGYSRRALAERIELYKRMLWREKSSRLDSSANHP